MEKPAINVFSRSLLTGNTLRMKSGSSSVKNGCVPKLYQAVGRDDFLYPSNVYVRKLLEQKQADLTYKEDKGGHDWNFWDQYIQHILDWMLHD